MISVVVPNLNEEAHIPLFLESLEAQISRDFELIIVDGGSTDRSLDLILGFHNTFHIHLTIDPTRNIGYIRNVGSRLAKGDILLHTNSDCYLPPTLLKDLSRIYASYPDLISVAGRTRPLNCSTFCSLSYISFDVLRWFFSHLGKYRPGGSFLSIRTKPFRKLLGFPEVKINEDGHLGEDLNQHRMKCKFAMNLWIGHSPAKRWEASGLSGFNHYTYVFGNFLSFKVFQDLEEHAAQRFSERARAELEQ